MEIISAKNYFPGSRISINSSYSQIWKKFVREKKSLFWASLESLQEKSRNFWKLPRTQKVLIRCRCSFKTWRAPSSKSDWVLWLKVRIHYTSLLTSTPLTFWLSILKSRPKTLISTGSTRTSLKISRFWAWTPTDCLWSKKSLPGSGPQFSKWTWTKNWAKMRWA